MGPHIVTAFEELPEAPQELRRIVCDLVAISMLPALWIDHDAQRIADSVAEVLVSMLGLEFVYVSVRPGRRRPAVHVARAASGLAPDPTGVVRDALAPSLDNWRPEQIGTIANPVGSGTVRIACHRAGSDGDGVIVAGSTRPDFPTTSQRLLLGVAANQAAIALQRWEAGQALRQLNETLEQRIAAEIRERMKLEEVYRQAQKMDALGQLTGGVAHDFNNLLTVIMGSLEAIERSLPAPPPAPEAARMQRSVNAALEGARRAATLTHRLLAFSRQQTLEPKPVEANRLVGEMSELLRRTLGESVAIETVMAAGLWRTFADPNQLESALLNLAVNARDAMPEGGRLTIETANAYMDDVYAARNGMSAGQYVVLAVTDTGLGMDQATVQRAFDPFFTTKGPGRGTGLGLSQVYGFVKQSNGHVKIYSEPGQGTTVKIYLRRLLGEAAAAADKWQQAEEPVGARGAGTILVVEDDDDVRAYGTEVLRELGYRVLEAPNAAAALEVLDRQRDVGLLFTDVVLPPPMNGRQLADEACRRRPGLKVLFTTGYARNAIIHAGQLDPGIQLIGKPFTSTDLSVKVQRALEGSECDPESNQEKPPA